MRDFLHSLSLSFRSKVAITTFKFLPLETLKEVAITTLQFHVGISPVLLSDTQLQDTFIQDIKELKCHVSPQQIPDRRTEEGSVISSAKHNKMLIKLLVKSMLSLAKKNKTLKI